MQIHNLLQALKNDGKMKLKKGVSFMERSWESLFFGMFIIQGEIWTSWCHVEAVVCRDLEFWTGFDELIDDDDDIDRAEAIF